MPQRTFKLKSLLARLLAAIVATNVAAALVARGVGVRLTTAAIVFVIGVVVVGQALASSLAGLHGIPVVSNAILSLCEIDSQKM